MSSKRLYYYYCRASIAAAVVMTATVYCLMPPSADALQGAFVFAALAFISELKPVSVRTNMFEVTITVPIVWASMVLFGPLSAMLVAGLAVAGANGTGWISARVMIYLRSKNRMPRLQNALATIAGPWEDRAEYPAQWVIQQILSNASQDAIAVGAAAIIYNAIGGNIATHEVLVSVPVAEIFTHFIIPFFIAVLAYLLIDEVRLIMAIILGENRPEDTRDWYSFFLRCKMLLIESLPVAAGQYLLLPPVTLLMLYLYVHVGLISGLVVVGPFLALRSAVQKSVEQQQLYMDTIATLGTYMQHYHPYTRGHLKRVADMSERLARELRLNAQTVMLMPYAGLMHDIGKVGVSEDILDKVGKLTDEEWATIKEHPVKGAEIVSHIEFLDQTVDWIKYHHKWANGSGYPDDGVKNGKVPIEAAIIAVADAFDAMTDDREMSISWECDSCGYKPDDGQRPEFCPVCNAPKRRTYRKPLSVDEAIDELRRGAGTQFSPEVVKAFLQLVDREGVKVGGNV